MRYMWYYDEYAHVNYYAVCVGSVPYDVTSTIASIQSGLCYLAQQQKK